MNIDAESIALLSLILRDAPQDRQLILCVLARSNQVPSQIKFHSNTEYPTFYGYSNERIPFYLMGKKVISNVPREGPAKRLISSEHLAYAETAISKTGNWDLSQKLFFVAKFIKLDNRTAYKDVALYLVFRDKAQDYIRDYVNQNRENISPFLGSKIGRFEFGNKLLKQREEPSQDKNKDLKTRYNQLLQEIRQPTQQTPKSLTLPQSNNTYSFNLVDNVLYVNGKPIRFRKDARTLSLLKLLMKKPKGIYYSEGVKRLEGAVDNIRNPKNTYYEVCRGIANRLAKIGITDFLQYDYNQAKLNPTYKNLAK